VTRQQTSARNHPSRKGGRPGLAGKFVAGPAFDPTRLIELLGSTCVTRISGIIEHVFIISFDTTSTTDCMDDDGCAVVLVVPFTIHGDCERIHPPAARG
jgi:hypothetical protein